MVCLPITILPTILGIFEIIYAAKTTERPTSTRTTSTSIAVFQILTFLMGNIFSMVVGILTLIFYNDLDSQGLLLAPQPAPRLWMPQLQPPQPILEVSTPALPLEAVEVPASEEPVQPEKVKRTRKAPDKIFPEQKSSLAKPKPQGELFFIDH